MRRTFGESNILRSDITPAIEQSGRSSEKPIVSEGGPLPKTWREAVPYVVWGVLVLGFGLEFVTALVHAEWLHAIVSFVGLIGLMAVALHWTRLKTWATHLSPNWVAATFSLLFLAIILAPFAEQRRWPFSIVFHDPPTAEDIAKTTAPIQAQLDAANRELQAERQKAKPLMPPGQPLITESQAAKELETVRSQIADLKQQNDALRQASSQQAPATADQSPIKWGQLGFGYMGGAEPTFIDIEIPASITGALPVELKDAYIISGTTGARLPMMLDAGKAGKILPREAYPIPNGISFYLTAELKPPLSTLDLLSQWGKVYFFAEYGDKKYQATFDENYMRTQLSKYRGSPLGAHITKKPDAK